MRYLEETSQIPVRVPFLRVAKLARPILLFGIFVVGTSLFLPQTGLSEVSTHPPRDLSETLTFNYSLAIGGSHPGLPTGNQSTQSLDQEPAPTQNISSLFINTQSSSSAYHSPYDEPLIEVQEQTPTVLPSSTDSTTKDGPGSLVHSDFLKGNSTMAPSVEENPEGPNSFYHEVIVEEVPSYIIHEPASHHRTTVSRENVNSVPHKYLEGNLENQVTAPLAKEPGDLTPRALPETVPLPTFSRFEWTFIAENELHHMGEVRSPAPLTFPFQSHFHGLSKPQHFFVRFAQVFHPSWEPLPPHASTSYGTIPLVLNDAVAKNLEYFQNGIHERFQTYLDRFHHYQKIVEPIFREFGIPTELMYLSLVESGFNPRAYSRARASGPWQFMKATGRMYQLKVNWYVDERRDPIKSTVAAAHHLRDLYDRFGSWPLALAAYNAGSGKISRAIRKTKTRDFWKIRRTWYIRRETKEYVPRFIAATLIAKNPTAYGFQLPSKDQHAFEEVLISKPVHFSAITKGTGISLDDLKRLNPELRRSIIPNSKGPGYYLKVPVGMASLVEAHHPTFPVWTKPPPPPSQWYRVRWGDSLSVVAKRFGMKVRHLKDMNNLSSNLIRVGTRLRVRGGDVDYADNDITWYRVRDGDSLGKIARRFNTSVPALKRLNNLSTNLIFPGNRLRVQGHPRSGTASSQGSQLYRVRHGDSLGKIASRFNTSVLALKRLNNLSTNLIFPDDRLRVKGEPSPRTSNSQGSKWYRVKRGDSLWSIAQQFSLSVKDLRALNNLSSSIIRSGHMLLVNQ